MRLTQSLFPRNRVRLHCFVDDPIAGVRGQKPQRRRYIAIMILVWEAVGFKLAYRKGQLGKEVTWIGATLQVTADGTSARVKQTIVDDIVTALDQFKLTNIISKKELRSFVGRTNHAAGLLTVLRPFLHAIWAALSSESTGPENTVWVKQIDHALSWLRAFFAADVQGIQRHFALDEYRMSGPAVEICTDASPWGLGGWMSVDGQLIDIFCMYGIPVRLGHFQN